MAESFPTIFEDMETLLMNLQKGSKVGFIINQVKLKLKEALKSSDYYDRVLDILRQAKFDTTLFELHRLLILEDHGDDFRP
ncbi:hypothetical protein BGX23_012344 [Mortierella sp. AD031]|nr:hypothetical protein BGX23_012344 [Mortierella sp. AD031]